MVIYVGSRGLRSPWQGASKRCHPTLRSDASCGPGSGKAPGLGALVRRVPGRPRRSWRDAPLVGDAAGVGDAAADHETADEDGSGGTGIPYQLMGDQCALNVDRLRPCYNLDHASSKVCLGPTMQEPLAEEHDESVESEVALS